MAARPAAILLAVLLGIALVPAPAEAHPVKAYCDPDQGQAEVWWHSYASQLDPNDPNTWVSTLVYVNTSVLGNCPGPDPVPVPGVCFVDAGGWPQPSGCADHVAVPWCSVMCDWNLGGAVGVRDWPPKECLEIPQPGEPYQCRGL